jgi:hypothetical protein
MPDMSFFESRNGYKAMFHVTQLLETVIKLRIKCSLTFQICLEEWDRSLCRFVRKYLGPRVGTELFRDPTLHSSLGNLQINTHLSRHRFILLQNHNYGILRAWDHAT